MSLDGDAGAELEERGGPHEHGAGRVAEHPLLGALTPGPTISFTFDSGAVEGREGEPIAAALLAAGYRILGARPRFGDVRGGYCMVGRCADCLVMVDGAPNVLACVTPVAAGMAVRTQQGRARAEGLGSPELEQ